jgi:hypothetical protein
VICNRIVTAFKHYIIRQRKSLFVCRFVVFLYGNHIKGTSPDGSYKRHDSALLLCQYFRVIISRSHSIIALSMKLSVRCLKEASISVKLVVCVQKMKDRAAVNGTKLLFSR